MASSGAAAALKSMFSNNPEGNEDEVRQSPQGSTTTVRQQSDRHLRQTQHRAGQTPPAPPGGGINMRLLFAIIAASTGSSFQHGYNTGVVNAPQMEIEGWLQGLVKERLHMLGRGNKTMVIMIWSIAVSVYCIGGMVGGLMTGIVANKLGRKNGLLVNNSLVLVGSLLEGFSMLANSFEMLILGRFVIGINSGLNAGLVPMYLAEIAPVRLRGAVATTYQLILTISILVSQILGLQVVLGSVTLWPALLCFTVLPAIFQVCSLPFCPESPKYLLVTRGKENQAEKALMWLRNTKEVQEEMEAMWAEMDLVKTMPKVTLKEMFLNESLRTPLIISVVVMISQQFSGINVIIFYSTSIFELGHLTHTQAELGTLVMGIINVAFTVLSLFLVEKSGRKILLLAGYIGMLVADVLITVSLSYAVKYLSLSYLCIALVLVLVMMFAIGPGPIPWFLVSELFNQSSRPVATSIAVGVNWMANFIVGLTFLPMQQVLKEYVFVIFIVFLCIFVIFIWKKVPETKNKTTEEITSMFKSNVYANQ